MDNRTLDLQFTLEDRDMLRDTNNGVQRILEKLDPLHVRVQELERLRDELTGWKNALAMTWLVVGGIGAAVLWLFQIRGKV